MNVKLVFWFLNGRCHGNQSCWLYHTTDFRCYSIWRERTIGAVVHERSCRQAASGTAGRANVEPCLGSTLCLVKRIPGNTAVRQVSCELSYIRILYFTLLLPVTRVCVLDFNNFRHDYFAESRQLKDAIISHLTWLVYLHYLVKLKTRKLHLFT